jgi:hypothetical protein
MSLYARFLATLAKVSGAQPSPTCAVGPGPLLRSVSTGGSAPCTAFWADLPNNAINLTPGFFTSLTDGSRVTLTFHFWSGATVTYHVTKSGTSITGTKGQP